MQATVRMDKLNRFKHHLKEGNALTIQRYSLGEIKLKFRMVYNAMRLSFLSNTEVDSCTDFNGSVHGFVWRDFKSITVLEKEEDDQFDVVGQVIACEELDNYDKNGKAGKKTRAMRLNARCGGDYAQQFNDFLNSCDDHGRIVLVLQFAMMKFWDGKMCIQNGYWGTKLYLFYGNKAISEDEYKEVEEFRQRLFANQPSEQSENTATKISTTSKNSTKDNFVNRHPIRNIAELLDMPYSKLSLLDIFGTIITIQEDEGWWYLECRACRGKVIKSTDYVDLESEMPKKTDETGTMSLSLFNDEVRAMVGRSAYQLCEKYAKSESDGSIPMEITNLIGNKYAFKVAIDDYNVKKLLLVFTVLRFSNDQETRPLYKRTDNDNSVAYVVHAQNARQTPYQQMVSWKLHSPKDLVVSDEEKKNVALFYIEELMRSRGTTLRRWRYISEFGQGGIRRKGDIVLNVASSGIASLLMSGGRTTLSTFLLILMRHLLAPFVRKASSPSYSKRFMARHCKRVFKAILLVESLQEWILKVGDSELSEANNEEMLIDVPEELLIDVVDDLSHLLLSEEMVYLSCDSIDKIKRGGAIDESIFSPEFINGLKFSGVPNHRLALKVGVPIMLLRNIDQANGLCNKTRLQVLRLTRTSIQAQIINGTHFGKEVIISRLRITPSDKRLTIKIVRKQYPLSLSFAMAINKSQGQYLSKLVCTSHIPFSHMDNCMWLFQESKANEV
ncbi:replication protein A 70 kDa DNA-binding subunit B [Tanacetum coccineum]